MIRHVKPDLADRTELSHKQLRLGHIINCEKPSALVEGIHDEEAVPAAVDYTKPAAIFDGRCVRLSGRWWPKDWLCVHA